MRWKGRNTTLLFIADIIVHLKIPQINKLLEINRKYNQVIGSKVKKQRVIAFLYVSNEQFTFEV